MRTFLDRPAFVLLLALVAVAVLAAGCDTCGRAALSGSPRTIINHRPHVEIEGDVTDAGAAAIAEAVALKSVNITVRMTDSDLGTNQGKTVGVDALTDPTVSASQNGDATTTRTGDSNRTPTGGTE